MARRKTADTIRHPAAESWKEDFKRTTFRTSFSLVLSQAMIEFLCAVADGVMWDRYMHPVTIHRPDNWVASEAALTKRGLIRRKCRSELDRELHEEREHGEWSCCELTPAGEAVVQLFRATGVFVELSLIHI